jgi:serine phosphatase RsbU (regulator of sigma subunit)
MAPEMAEGDPARIGPQSDIYLLGGMLYELVTGLKPHTGNGVMGCLLSAAENIIQPTDQTGELVDIALKAMATEPAARYASVKTFQQALQAYRQHAESLVLTAQAEQELQAAEASGDYDQYAQALYGFREAVKLWDGNDRAQRGVEEASLAYSKCACEKGDYDLAEALLLEGVAEHTAFKRTVQTAVQQRQKRRRRARTMTVAAAGLLVLIAVMATVGFFWIRQEQEATSRERDRALKAEKKQRELRQLAEGRRKAAEQALVYEKRLNEYNTELYLAREIQRKLLPPKMPHVRGVDIHAHYEPATEVGGDYFDLFPIDKEHLGVIVADVSNKGIPSSMVMATTRTVLRFTAAGNRSAADTLRRTNRVVAADIRQGMFVTAFYLVLNVRTHEMCAASAGHNPMVIYRAETKTVDLISLSGIALGVDKGPSFDRTIKEKPMKLNAGDRVVLYTNGVVEAIDAANEEYTTERLVDFVKTNTTLTSKEFVDALLDELEAHRGDAEQHDDITVVTFQIK